MSNLDQKGINKKLMRLFVILISLLLFDCSSPMTKQTILTSTLVIDYRANPQGTVKQKFSAQNTSYGSTAMVSVSYRF